MLSPVRFSLVLLGLLQLSSQVAAYKVNIINRCNFEISCEVMWDDEPSNPTSKVSVGQRLDLKAMNSRSLKADSHAIDYYYADGEDGQYGTIPLIRCFEPNHASNMLSLDIEGPMPQPKYGQWYREVLLSYSFESESPSLRSAFTHEDIIVQFWIGGPSRKHKRKPKYCDFHCRIGDDSCMGTTANSKRAPCTYKGDVFLVFEHRSALPSLYDMENGGS